MTDDNSAERDAEEILRAAAAEIQAEQCPQGKDCGVHFRVDEALSYPEDEDARYISYVGDFVVVTEDNHEWGDPMLIVAVALGQKTAEELPDRWETSIFWVGSGTINDLTYKPNDVRKGALRYSVTHDSFARLKSEHDATVSMLYSGMIDVSKPLAMGD